MDNLPWIEKYRPNNLSEIVSHKEIVNLLKNLRTLNRIPNLILYGPPGTGKTSIIHAYAKEIYGSKYKFMILELNCSDDRGINIVREQIKNFSSTRSNLTKFLINEEDNNFSKENNIKLIILDEADALTYDAQYALRRVIEIYSNKTRFCFICNYLSKLIPAIQSRCQLLRFNPIDREEHFIKLTEIQYKENINIDEESKNKIISLSDGDMRKSLNLFQTLSMSSKNIDIDIIYNMIGYPIKEDRNNLINILKENDINKIYSVLYNIQNKYNLSNSDIIKEISDYFSDVSINNKYSKKYQNKLLDLYDNLANIEINITNNVDNNIHLKAIASIVCLINL